MIRKLTFVLATTMALAAMPQIAHASCSGTACSSFSYSNGKFTNKDKVRPIHLTGCFVQANGSCATSGSFDVTVDFNQTKSVNPPAGLGSNAKVDVKTAAFIGGLTNPHVQTLPNGNVALVEIKAVKVINNGKLPLKVVILDEKFSELGRTADYKTGSFDVELKTNVSKYHWEVFAPGDKEPCQKLRDETKNSITVGCDKTKASDALPPLPPAATVGSAWADKCNANGAGGPKGTCCARLRTAEPHCKLAPGVPRSAGGLATLECDTAEKMCQAGLH